MLDFISHKCTNILIKYDVIDEKRSDVFQYGFELIWSTFFCAVCILTLGVIFQYIELALCFLLFFVPIRLTAGGYHAKTFGKCFWISNVIVVGNVWMAKMLCIWNLQIVDMFLSVGFLLAIWYIWKQAPVNISIKKVSEKKIESNRKHAHGILIYDIGMILLLILMKKKELIVLAMISICTVAIMMKIGKEGAKKWV